MKKGNGSEKILMGFYSYAVIVKEKKDKIFENTYYNSLRCPRPAASAHVSIDDALGWIVA